MSTLLDLCGTVLVIGAGRFGARAVNLLVKTSTPRILVVDPDRQRLDALRGGAAELIMADGIDFLVDVFEELRSEDIIVPALPLHLAAEWLKADLGKVFRIVPRRIPEQLPALLPNPWRAGDDLLLTSYADFICPEDCEEPEQCTVTGETRQPMRQRFKGLRADGFSVYGVSSLQLAPGAGGYRAGDLADLRRALMDDGAPHDWLVGTACKCHGMLSAFGVEARSK